MPRTLSEAESKRLLESRGIRFAPERLVDDPEAAVDAARDLGYPVVAKLCGDNVAHKTERSLVRLGLRSDEEVSSAAAELLGAATPEDAALGVLVASQVNGTRELIAGTATDPQFGATVLVGIGGILAEAVQDVAVRLVPISRTDAHEMLEELGAQALLGEFRGEPELDREAMVEVLLALSAAMAEPADDGSTIVSVDLNPLIVHEGRPVPVDALVEVAHPDEGPGPGAAGRTEAIDGGAGR